MNASTNTAPAILSTNTSISPRDFYTIGNTPKPEVIEGLVREQQIVALAGSFGVGKSPLLADFTVHAIHGIPPWCGRQVSKRPVIAVDFETPGNVYRDNLERISARLGVPVPKVNEELEPYLYLDNMASQNTAALHAAMADPKDKVRFDLLVNALKRKPNALVLLDPLELLFRLDKLKSPQILKLYSDLRALLSNFPHAAILSTFNLRKSDRKNGRPDLLLDPRGWLDEVCGSLDLLNRCDVRLGFDERSEAKVLNGLRRGEGMTPTVVQSIEVAPLEYAGFEIAPGASTVAEAVLKKTELKHWNSLPDGFTFSEGEKIVPHSSLDRLVKKCVGLGLLVNQQGRYAKVRS